MKVYELFEDEKNIYIITEFIQGGELMNRLKKKEFFSEEESKKIIIQVLSAVNYCHTNNIVHR